MAQKKILIYLLGILILPFFASSHDETKQDVSMREDTIAMKNPIIEKESIAVKDQNSSAMFYVSSFNLHHVFRASPIIYSILIFMSVGALSIWLYSLITFRSKREASPLIISELKTYLKQKNYPRAVELCSSNQNLLANLILVAITSRNHGAQFMTDAMKAEGKRITAGIWQRISLLNDIVLIAPMFGLLGTVIGMFYAFYDMNRSRESLSALFDGLGIAVGTTVAGLIVAIVAMIFSTTLKYRLIKTLNHVENEAISMTKMILEEGPSR